MSACVRVPLCNLVATLHTQAQCDATAPLRRPQYVTDKRFGQTMRCSDGIIPGTEFFTPQSLASFTHCSCYREILSRSIRLSYRKQFGSQTRTDEWTFEHLHETLINSHNLTYCMCCFLKDVIPD